MEKKWQIRQPDARAVNELSAKLHCHPITAAVLLNRNLTSVQKASSFITTSLNMIRSPFNLKDMTAAVQRIYHAIIDHEKILIFGDYDVDGITDELRDGGPGDNRGADSRVAREGLCGVAVRLGHR